VPLCFYSILCSANDANDLCCATPLGNLVSLTCLKGVDTAQVDISSLIFTCLEKVTFVSENESDMQFITTVLENSIPQGRGFLKSLFLRHIIVATTNSPPPKIAIDGVISSTSHKHCERYQLKGPLALYVLISSCNGDSCNGDSCHVGSVSYYKKCV
jgi:hypothetical protein